MTSRPPLRPPASLLTRLCGRPAIARRSSRQICSGAGANPGDRWQLGTLTVEVAKTPCVVSAPWGAPRKGAAFASSRPADAAFADAFRALLNPANPSLAGTARPYFPRGGPLPPPPPKGLETSSRGWGGLDAGPGMLYPAQVVDGLVHAQAGGQLRMALGAVEEGEGGVRCQVGAALATPAFALPNFDVVSHTPPPFWPTTGQDDFEAFLKWAEALASCYVNGASAVTAPLATAATAPRAVALASPLLGAGAAGAPAGAAAAVAVQAVRMLAAAHVGVAGVGRGADSPPPLPLLLRFVLPGEAEAEAFARVAHAKLGPPAGAT